MTNEEQTPARVLVVDDEKSIRITVQQFLRTEGHEVRVAADAFEAMDILKADRIDVVVSDIILPRMSGVELLKWIEKASPQVKVIMMTGEPTVETATEALRKDAFDYLAKPVGKEAILNVVAKAVQVKRLEAENRAYRDNLERMVAERTRQFQESQEKYESIVENVGMGVALVGPGMEILELNRQMREWYPRVSSRESPSCTEFCCDRFQEPPDSDCPVRRSLADGQVHEKKMVGIGESRRIRRLVASPVKNAQGAVAGVIAIVEDITDRLQMEEAVQQSQKMEAVGRLAGGIAHDFNNLLTVILGFSDFLQEDLEPEDERHQFVEEIRKASERAASLTHQLLAFGRKTVLQLDVFDLNGVIEETAKMLKRLVGEDLELVVDGTQEPALVEADQGQMVQVLMNLAVNARDAMPDGGKLTIAVCCVDTRDDKLFDPELEPGPYVLLRVSDTGVGMDEETRRRIFEPFFTTKEPGKGTGLGLPTVYGIVKQCGGGIECTSEVGKGTTFSIFLPECELKQEFADKILDESPVQGTETILVVEDEEEVRASVAQALARQGYTVLEASNGREGLAACERAHEQIGLALTDVVMPEMGGIAFGEEMNRRYPRIKVVFMSGYVDELGELVSEPALREIYVQKPIRPRELLAKVRAILDAGMLRESRGS